MKKMIFPRDKNFHLKLDLLHRHMMVYGDCLINHEHKTLIEITLDMLLIMVYLGLVIINHRIYVGHFG